MSVKNKTEEELGAYRISVTGRHVLVTDAMKAYVTDKLSKIDRFSHQAIEIVVTMDIQKLEHRVGICMKLGHTRIKVQASSSDMYASIDKAVGKLISKIHRYKDRIQNHHNRATSVVDMTVNVYRRPVSELEDLNDDIEEENRRQLEQKYRPHEVVKQESRPLKTLSIEEAVMKMELTDDAFLVYLSEEDQKIKVIYRREDGDYGVIDPN